ncbi:hypothetical protein [Bartonella sp. TP]|uniref:hypothetical protein n=1 Tax=Bartonella sp. TP TaxID=3057550 RepID=UPI0025B0191C|nr:hypothetical protein [Bartonella sp. TP]MDN5249201.1 hypothetical protein [Alphaproteobacteria bacterium]WJW80289.1 hypothetical protein QVL57_01630 [Bartonella sp. TP]
MQSSSKRYKKLLKAQRLIKLRDEMQVRILEKEKNKLDEDKLAMYDMLQKLDKITCDPVIISKALSRNAVSKRQVEQSIAIETQKFLQSQHRVELLQTKQIEASRMEERKRVEANIIERVALQTIKVSFT